MTSDSVTLLEEQSPKPRRRWLRFSLRSLLLLVVVVAIPLGWKVNRARNQVQVVAELEKLNAWFKYDYEIRKTEPGPKWLIDRLGKEYFVEVIQVTVGGPQVSDETISRIARLPKLEYVNLRPSSKITDKGLVHFAGMHGLQGVDLFSDGISGAGLVNLTGLERLKSLSISGWATDASLGHVATLSRLESLWLHEAVEVTDEGIAQIANLTNLRGLRLGGRWDDSGIQDSMKITDQGLETLYGLENLEFFHLDTVNVTQAGIDKLGETLPNCEIEWNSKGRQATFRKNEKGGETVTRPEG